jgi:hypothetical protein
MKGEYPKPFKLTPGGRNKAWLASEIAAYQAWRKAVRDGKAKKDDGWRDYLTEPSASDTIKERGR